MSRSAKRLMWFVLGLGWVCIASCVRPPATTPAISGECPLILDPPTIDLGDVAGSLTTFNFSFAAENRAGEPLSISIQPGCSCTSIDQPPSRLAGYSSASIAVAINLKQRVGPVHEVIRVKCRREDDPSADWTVDLPIEGAILNLWRASPQRVILDGQGTAMVRVSAPTAEWREVVAAAIGDGVEIEETSVETRQGIETRAYQVQVSDAVTRNVDHGIGFDSPGTNRRAFVVPVLVR